MIDYSDIFFLQIPSVDKWSNLTVIIQPTGFMQGFTFNGVLENPLIFIIRIYTNKNGVGRIQMDGEYINDSLYRRISTSNFYYYETMTLNNTHLISAFDLDVIYSVSCMTLIDDM